MLEPGSDCHNERLALVLAHGAALCRPPERAGPDRVSPNGCQIACAVIAAADAAADRSGTTPGRARRSRRLVPPARLGVEVTTGEKNEGEMIAPQVDEVKATTGVDIKTVTADAGYAYAKVYGALERRGIDALIPAKAEPIRSRVPLRRSRYDAKSSSNLR